MGLGVFGGYPDLNSGSETMKLDVDWIRKRKASSKVIAFIVESEGVVWPGLREGVHIVAAKYQISVDRKRRSQIAVACMEHFERAGGLVPGDYVVPWIRNGAPPKLTRPSKDAHFLAFYDSFDWRQVRYDVLRERGRKCECCGDDDPKKVQVDHIKPLRKYWHLRFDKSNLQVLCHDCNHGKGSRDKTDWRAQ